MLKLSYELSHNLVSSKTASHLYVLVKVTAPKQEGITRKLLNLGVVLDRSLSMTGKKMDFLKHATKFLVTQLSGDDILSLTIFDHEVETLLAGEKVVNKEIIKNQIDRIEPRGTTNLSGGWLASTQEVMKNQKDDRINRIILLTDGQANEGITQYSQLLSIARDLAARGLKTSTIGFGEDFDENLLRGIASSSGSNFYFVDSPEKAPRVFAEELSELLSLFAQNLVLTVEPSPQVSSVDILHDLPVKRDKNKIIVTIGDIFSGDEKWVLIQFTTPASRAEKEVGISVLNLSFQQIYPEVSLKEISAFVKVGYGHPDEVAAQKINPVVHREILLTGAIKARNDAVSLADTGELTKAKDRINNSIKDLKDSQYTNEDIVKEEVKRLNNLLSSFDTKDLYSSIGRKSALTQSYYSSRKKELYSTSRIEIVPWEIVEKLKNSASVTVITGQGLSTQAGIPDLRSETLLAENHRALDVFSKERFQQEPQLVWKCIDSLREQICRTDLLASHRIIAEMENFWKNFSLVTETVDGMHKIAGNKNITELFGNIFRMRCTEDGRIVETSADRSGEKVCSCGNPLRPDLVLAGEEPQKLEQVKAMLSESQVIILICTTFNHSEGLILEARKKGAIILVFNLSKTPISDIAHYTVNGKVNTLLPMIWKEVKR